MTQILDNGVPVLRADKELSAAYFAALAKLWQIKSIGYFFGLSDKFPLLAGVRALDRAGWFSAISIEQAGLIEFVQKKLDEAATTKT